MNVNNAEGAGAALISQLCYIQFRFSKSCPLCQPKNLCKLHVILLYQTTLLFEWKTKKREKRGELNVLKSLKMNSCLLSMSRKPHFSLGFIRTWPTIICFKWLRLCVCYHLSHGHSVMGSNRNVQWLSALQQHSFPSLLSPGPVSLSSRYSRSNGF